MRKSGLFLLLLLFASSVFAQFNTVSAPKLVKEDGNESEFFFQQAILVTNGVINWTNNIVSHPFRPVIIKYHADEPSTTTVDVIHRWNEKQYVGLVETGIISGRLTTNFVATNTTQRAITSQIFSASAIAAGNVASGPVLADDYLTFGDVLSGTSSQSTNQFYILINGKR